MTFEMNGNAYSTDAETLEVLRSIVPSAKVANDMSAVILVMDLGEATGRISLMGRSKDYVGKRRRASKRVQAGYEQIARGWN